MSNLSTGDLVRRLERWAPFLLLGGTAAFYLLRLGEAGLYDPNEGMYAEIPREMVLLRDWLTPHFNFIRYFEKPPLLYWLTAMCYELLGFSEFSSRLVSVLAAIGGVGVIYGIGRDLWGRRVGLVSGLILATSFGYFIFSRIIVTDMLLLSGAKLRLHVRSRRFVRREGPWTCRARRKSSALPAGPPERGGPPPLLGLSPGLCGPR